MNCTSYKGKVEEAVTFLSDKITITPQVILVLGTGLGGLVDQINDAVVFPYPSIPHFPQSSVIGHAGNLIFGQLKGKDVAVLNGRVHYYEGYSTQELTLPIRVLALLGADYLVVSNVAGGLNQNYTAGTLMIIRDHLNFIPDNPLRGPNIDEWGVRFPDLSTLYDQTAIVLALRVAAGLGLDNVVSGVYAAVAGPSMETPAETRYLCNCGADGVGMSTVPEVIVAKHAGLKVLAISVIANVNHPDNMHPIMDNDVFAQIKKTEASFMFLVMGILHEL